MAEYPVYGQQYWVMSTATYDDLAAFGVDLSFLSGPVGGFYYCPIETVIPMDIYDFLGDDAELGQMYYLGSTKWTGSI